MEEKKDGELKADNRNDGVYGVYSMSASTETAFLIEYIERCGWMKRCLVVVLSFANMQKRFGPTLNVGAVA